MKQYLIEKYEGYIKNLEYHLETNSSYLKSDIEIGETEARLRAYREILTDLKML